jgi:hypothetical protein
MLNDGSREGERLKVKVGPPVGNFDSVGSKEGELLSVLLNDGSNDGSLLGSLDNEGI